MALTAVEQASPLARRPYDLRHACLSTWLNGGVYPTQVAEWAGHGVDVLLRIYARYVVGQDELVKHRISDALHQDGYRHPAEAEAWSGPRLLTLVRMTTGEFQFRRWSQ